GPRKCARKTRH
nr:Chain C, ICP0 [Human alphaherpesvirus 1 strain 17]4WPH_D Chain D, ICP0 [Human alphaherpesvirus 1 strain 17]4WPI_C Chain C, ICP0 [Human alphaherpesvirus 1 strain 17]4WPI_D Chain D, ICP0 [Human alphaherpesvirus 1 strain 17]